MLLASVLTDYPTDQEALILQGTCACHLARQLTFRRSLNYK